MRNLQLLGVGLAGALALGACTTTPSATTAPTNGTANLTGVVTFNGKAPTSNLTIGLKQVANGQITTLSQTATTASDGSYSFTGLQPGTYEAYFSSGTNATFTTNNINTVGYYNFAEVNLTANQSLAEPTVDLYWLANPSPNPGGAVSISSGTANFSWQPKSGAVQYQIFIGQNSASIYSSPWASATSASWNFTNSNTSSTVSPGTNYVWQIKFADATGGSGVSPGQAAFTGSWGGTNNIPLTVNS